MSKATGLAAFTRKGTSAVELEKPVGEVVVSEKARGRGKGDVVALTVPLASCRVGARASTGGGGRRKHPGACRGRSVQGIR